MIIEFLKSNIIGGLGDQVGGFIALSNKKLIGAPFNNNPTHLLESNQPIFSLIYNEGSQIFNPILFSNLFSIISVLLLLIFCFLLFKYLKVNIFVSLLLSILFTFSPYTYLHLGVHPALMQVWMIPAGIILLLKSQTLKQQIITGVFIAFAIFVSNYLGYFLLLFAGSFLLANITIKLTFKKFTFGWFKLELVKYLVIFGVVLLICIPTLLTYFKSSYRITPSFDGGVSRTLEDFQNFSGRPWYLVLPPIQNPVFGGVTKSVLNWMKSDWGYFLADDYFNNESPEMFLGWGNILVFIFSIAYFVKRSKCQMTNDKIKTALIFGLTGFLVFLFTFPPYFDFAGHKIYTLGFILYKLFPMFRVTQRLGIVILMCVLIVNGVFLSEIVTRYKNFKTKLLLVRLIIIGYIVFTLFEFYIPITITDVSKTPEVYTYLAQDTKKVSFNFVGETGRIGQYTGTEIIVTYPRQNSDDIFWITRHQKGLINPRNYENDEYGFDSMEFTKWLPTQEGLEHARSYGVSYIVFSKTDLQKEIKSDPNFVKSADPEKFFRENLVLEKDFGDILLFTLSAR
ncbi:MAG: hypothetical protein ABII16_03310 [Patescibacteria group bacterium]